MDAYRNRDIGKYMQRALRSMPVVVLTGMRQVGKTTLATPPLSWSGASPSYNAQTAPIT